ncbi:hypothetical protein [Deinococcus multiflagellatus]|uniref:Uncharacterized protein n=1 Tax=Deinococcus multiflagellatus TaxID=1656887 RepID=A0ABW1ZHZ6_9DEIO|nr:hypothetical protein [Deinococcus multiflagellatus]MBZ9713805.1 hypothetical protein [Deinococcus multiflagellatus]
MNNTILVAALVVAGGAVVVTHKKEDIRTPQQAVDQFIRALLLVDANMLADSLDEEQTGEEILAKTWGVLTPYIDRREPRDPNLYSWKVTDFKIAPAAPRYGTAKVEYKTADPVAQAERMLELQGAQYDAEGRLTGFDPKVHISEGEAARMAAADPNIPTLTYVVPVGLIRPHKDSQHWAIDPSRKFTQALLNVVVNGNGSESNEQYRVKP